jgi:hypothetical protein
MDEMLRATAAADTSVTLFRIRRIDHFLGRSIRRSSGYPTWFGRLMRIGRVSVVREINEEFRTDGSIEHLKEHLLHFPFNRGSAHWFERHNRYSDLEAGEALSARKIPLAARELFSFDPVIRRRCLKRLAFRIPARPLLVFLYLYVVRLGLLDGVAGWHFCRMRAMYETMIDIKVAELNSVEAGTGAASVEPRFVTTSGTNADRNLL